MKHIVSYSGGKDSTTMLLKMIEKNMPIDEVVFCKIMATKDSGAEYPEMYEYLDKVNKYLIKTIGKGIKYIQSPVTFEEQFYKVKRKGKYIGEIYGFPWLLGAWCNSNLKTIALDKYFKSQGKYISYIGITYDEPKRLKRLAENEKAPLYDWKMTEADCLQYIKEKGLYNPLYDKYKRLGCWFCVKQGINNLRILRRDYPVYWKMLLEWQKDSKIRFHPKYTVQELEEKFSQEEYFEEHKAS
ncbi:MAG: phosphoadenosine phosphosulfate reductase family protein [Clostridia bacterium]|nr:phosphoadenosine phosphosulfate reductase family protein [Clostridia bacterium]